MGDAGSRRGVNFQKASCTIDASVKIYSHRVDDTWTSSLRMLENLSRNALDEDSDNEREEEGSEKVEKQAKVGSKSKSRKFDLLRTIEKDVSKLNATSLEQQGRIDPMFHLMSKAFDEGGAKGMLMTNLVSGVHNLSIPFLAHLIALFRFF